MQHRWHTLPEPLRALIRAQTMEARRLPCGTWIDFHGRRRVVDVHNRPGGLVLVNTNRGEFEVAATSRIRVTH